MDVSRVSRFLRFCARSTHRVGFVATLKWIFATAQLNLDIHRPNRINIKPRFLDHSVRLRACTSDPFVFRQIMIEDEYHPLAKVPLCTILDLGANVGLASAYFLSRFPGSRVFALEPDLDNFKACSDNLAPYRNRAHVMFGAAWSKRTSLILHRRTCAADNTVQETAATDENGISVEGWDIASLIEQSGFGPVDLIKIDIEGAEEDIFRDDCDRWLPWVRNLCIELHGEASRESFFSAMDRYDYRYAKYGELDFCLDLRRKPETAGR